jgi:hypothetical protein
MTGDAGNADKRQAKRVIKLEDKTHDKLAEIRTLYFSTTPKTILRDFDRAVDLLKAMDSEAERERATVYMQGLAEMRKEFGFGKKKGP